MLEANGQNSTRSEFDLRDCCADGMRFGALGRCPLCSGCLRYSGGMYRCRGYPSAWSKCSYSTTEPERVKWKWKIPEESSNDYLCKDEWKSKIKGAGGCVHNKIKKGGWKYLPLERTIWLTVSKDKKLPFDLYTIEAIGEESSMVTVKVKGPSAVLESSGLQNSGHILEDGKIIYNTTLNMSDLSTGVNRAAMMEFEINMSAMPLEKLSKSFEALTEIYNLLNSNVHNASYKESLIVDASNLFFTVIPSIHPHVIRDEDDFKSKTGFDVHNKESLDEKYKKLHSDIAPLPHDSNDYRLIENYLQTTHAPTHTILEARDLPTRSFNSDSTYKILETRDLPTKFYHLKHSTKGLGKKIPQESEYVKWKDEVVVLCGRPVTSNLMASELMYNEYIVYNTAQPPSLTVDLPPSFTVDLPPSHTATATATARLAAPRIAFDIELMEYSYLMDLADKCEDPYMRLIYACEDAILIEGEVSSQEVITACKLLELLIAYAGNMKVWGC
ncbi:hypothetical protein TEA_007843 [Camellia sinensis var. sinensis]|uniref:Uncharacterized protein n=1 Tax=Camellia sinensis var. sinensis TaxID=542762 RepID=A0A4S4EBJ1_CAMSN|nr:hypothetical protein TEA_007843 [Camellia sinensis var. sinensis]